MWCVSLSLSLSLYLSVFVRIRIVFSVLRTAYCSFEEEEEDICMHEEEERDLLQKETRLTSTSIFELAVVSY